MSLAKTWALKKVNHAQGELAKFRLKSAKKFNRELRKVKKLKAKEIRDVTK